MEFYCRFFGDFFLTDQFHKSAEGERFKIPSFHLQLDLVSFLSSDAWLQLNSSTGLRMDDPFYNFNYKIPKKNL